MDDLISRAVTQTELQLSARRYTVAHEAHGEGRVVWSEELISVSDAMDVLRKLPSTQPKRGKWQYNGKHGTFKIYTCDKCGWNYEAKHNYCPNCGAKMEVTE